ncbi:anhydro-N-acetylmuramic acid kinase (macronuclear) [Tetrahymena thermophila SB210]|uniref:Anhydro-N-acetylmuramic acid kinase n=1 Tax=Tetrahymena thermophila (strain SB210) TaxID=312017 RepID=I7M1Q7_TETTS|nr:anhydro-N-acetylmuramic acid kinase [Tetrahymena thermophila SB210]EAR97362.2 anhydro-N-acetylmuramic acid kinase [Tetrahymena thermophila SB210]|eukprot:XP_001017607.2 anhydro-N-acetylmuramic acid kinase [Tetrahymena thermophila SB210]
MTDNQIKTLNIIGVMSGTSLDGLDLAYFKFKYLENQKQTFNSKSFTYEIINAETIAYDENMRSNLINTMQMSGVELSKFDREYGKFIGESIVKFIKKFNIHHKSVDYVSSHGHTVFHNPSEQYTVQIGHGSSIAASCKIPTICDFRSLDVALGGQGAPLVPIGDKLLFAEYKYCLNIGGIINISFDINQSDEINQIRKAFDVSPGNMILNYLCKKYLNKEYDADGQEARLGKTHQELLNQLLNVEFFLKAGPKSLGKEHVEKDFLPLIEANQDLSVQDKLNTVVEMMAQTTAEQIKVNDSKQEDDIKVLATGGGAYNKYFIERLNFYLRDTKVQVIVPNNLIVEFKEALLFAFLGFLRILKLPNCLKSVTGASQDNIGGCLYLI